MTCTCTHPILTLDHHFEIWCACGHEPRDDLGTDRDPMERVKYRALLNRLRGQIPEPPKIVKRGDKEALRARANTERRDRRIERENERRAKKRADRPMFERECPVCGVAFETGMGNQKYCGPPCRTIANSNACKTCGKTISHRSTYCSKHRTGRKPNTAKHQTVIDLYVGGAPLAEIAASVGYQDPSSVATLLAALRNRGIEIPRRYQKRAA